MAASGESDKSKELLDKPPADSDKPDDLIEKSLIVHSDKLDLPLEKDHAGDSDIPDGASDRPLPGDSDALDDFPDKRPAVDLDNIVSGSDKLDGNLNAEVSHINVRLQDQNSRTCGACAKVANIEDGAYCLDCKLWLCSGCKEQHNSWPPFKHHQITDSPDDESPNYSACEIHAASSVKYFCVNCTEKTCPHCQLTDHYLHESLTLESRVDSITEDYERVIQEAKDLIGKYSNNVDELTKQKNDFTLETRRINNLLSEEKQRLIYDIIKECEGRVSSNNQKLAVFTEEIDKKLMEIREEISAHEAQLSELQEQQSSLTIESDLSNPDLPEVKEKQFEAISSPNIMKCLGYCVTDGVIKCTVTNIDGILSGSSYFSEEFTVKQSKWKLSVKQLLGDEKALALYAHCDINSNERSWPVQAAYTIRLLHPQDGPSKELNANYSYAKEIGYGWPKFCRWQELTDGGYVKNNEIVVELEVHPQTADGIACLCQNKHIWHTEIIVPRNLTTSPLLEAVPAKQTERAWFGATPAEATTRLSFGTTPAEPTTRLPFGATPAEPTTILPFGATPAEATTILPFGATPAEPATRLPFGATPAEPTTRLPFRATPAEPATRLPFRTTPAEPATRLPFGATPAEPTIRLPFGAAPAEPKIRPSFGATPAEPKIRPSFGATPAEPKIRPSFGATPAEPKIRPSFGATPAEPKIRPSFGATPAEPKIRPSFGAAPAEPKIRPLFGGVFDAPATSHFPRSSP